MNETLERYLGKIHHQDCVEGLTSVPAGSIDLVFADPPFNIGYEYDEYDDRLDKEKYVAWCNEWMRGIHKALKDDGTFWLAIGDEYAAELNLEAKKIGFHMRNWTVWYYTFGVHCHSKFTRSHAHLFYFVKNAEQFTFQFPEISVPSARQLVYADKRANPEGRTPDDTWILRPQDCTDGFQADEDTWYFPRVAGTFKERAGFHGCQMPEQLLGRIIRCCSKPGDIVVDPFSGSSTTLTVAKKLGRRFFGFELSLDYVARGTARVDAACVGDPLDGSEEPRASAPSSYAHLRTATFKEPAPIEQELNAEGAAIIEAFRAANRGFSVDRLILDPILNEDFQLQCDRRSVPGAPSERNRFLFRLRKSGRLKRAGVHTEGRTGIEWDEVDEFLHASEIAWQHVANLYSASLDDIFCDPRLASEFDRVAQSFAPGRGSLHYRWAALKLRKEAGIRRSNLKNASPDVETVLKKKAIAVSVDELLSRPPKPGVFVLSRQSSSGSKSSGYLFVGETQNLRRRFEVMFGESGISPWMAGSEDDLTIRVLSTEMTTRLANQMTLLRKTKGSRLNSPELARLP